MEPFNMEFFFLETIKSLYESLKQNLEIRFAYSIELGLRDSKILSGLYIGL